MDAVYGNTETGTKKAKLRMEKRRQNRRPTGRTAARPAGRRSPGAPGERRKVKGRCGTAGTHQRRNEEPRTQRSLCTGFVVSRPFVRFADPASNFRAGSTPPFSLQTAPCARGACGHSCACRLPVRTGRSTLVVSRCCGWSSTQPRSTTYQFAVAFEANP